MNKIILNEQGKQKGYVIYEITKNKENATKEKVKDITISVINEYQNHEEKYDIQQILKNKKYKSALKTISKMNKDIVSISVYTNIYNTDFKFLFVFEEYEQIKFKTFLQTIINIIDKEYKVNKKPLNITLLSYENIYTLSSFSDFEDNFIRDFNTYKNKKCLITSNNTTLKGNHTNGEIKNSFKATSNSRNAMYLKVKLRDVSLLTDKRYATITDLAEAIGIKREYLKVPEIEDLRALSKEKINKYFKYQTKVSEIIYKWTEESYGINLPEALSKYAENFAYEYLKKKIKAKNFNDFMKKYSGRWKRFNKSQKYIGLSYKDGFEDASEFARRSYYGGLNNTYTVGTFFNKTYDMDIKQAYTTAIYLLRDINFNKKPEDITNINPEEIKVNDYAFVKANVYYPEDFNHPCLPVKSEIFQTTVFVREATNVYLSAPEIWYAVNNGARVEIKGGYRLAKKKSCTMKDLARHLITERNKLKGEPLKEQIQKLTNNMIYGHISKGVTMTSMSFVYGKITNEYYASTLTSLVRVLLSQTMQLIEESETITKNNTKGMKMYTGLTITNKKTKGIVYESVTDGLVTNLTEEKVNKIMKDNKDNPIISMFLQARTELGKKNLPYLKQNLSEARRELRKIDKRRRTEVTVLREKIEDLKHKIKTINDIYEEKHRQDILYVGRTKNSIGINFDKPEKSIMMIANMNYPKQARYKAQQDIRLFVLHMILNRKNEELVSMYETIPRIKKIIINEKLDVSVNGKESQVNLEFDHKRIINNINDMKIKLITMNDRQMKNGKKEYIVYQATTSPHKDLDEFENHRDLMKKSKMMLTTKQDFIDFYSKVEYRESGINIRSDINTLNAKQILILLKKGVLIDKEERPGTELIKEVEDLFGVKLSYNNDYARAKNKRRLINFDFLMSDIKALNLTKA